MQKPSFQLLLSPLYGCYVTFGKFIIFTQIGAHFEDFDGSIFWLESPFEDIFMAQKAYSASKNLPTLLLKSMLICLFAYSRWYCWRLPPMINLGYLIIEVYLTALSNWEISYLTLASPMRQVNWAQGSGRSLICTFHRLTSIRLLVKVLFH